MSTFLLAAAASVLVTVVIGLIRVVHGPALTDRTAGVQLLSSGGMAVLILVGVAMPSPSAIDGAMVMAVLAPFAVIAIFRGAARRAA